MNLALSFWDRVVMDDIADCWLWVGGRNRRGYGVFHVGKSTTVAHRAALLAVGRRIPEGMVVDHLCRHRSCVNPDHLDIVTPRVNSIRGRRGYLGKRNGEHGSKYIGVARVRGKWMARVSHDGTRRYLGRFDAADEAARAYDAAVRSLHGPDADTNESLGLLVT